MKDSRRAGSVLGASLCESYSVLGNHYAFSLCHASRLARCIWYRAQASYMVMQTAEFPGGDTNTIWQ